MPTKNNKQTREKYELIDAAPRMNPLLVIGYLADSEVIGNKATHAEKCRRAVTRLGMKWEDIEGPSRLREFVTVRHMCFKYLRREGWTLREIGEHFNGRDHATALHGVKTADDLLTYDRDFKRKWLTFLQA